MLKTIIRLLLLFLLIAGGIWLWEQYKFLKNDNAEAPEVSHNILLQEITSMGKIELVKYNFRDVVESKIKKNFLRLINLLEHSLYSCFHGMPQKFLPILNTKLSHIF